MNKVKLGKYRHFKGHLVEVIGTALHSESLEEFVVYKKLENMGKFKKGSMWIRPLKMFTEKVTRDGKTFKRFSLIKEKKNKE